MTLSRPRNGRANLAEEVANLVRDLILDGRLPTGERINEVRLAAQIGVGRTPLREALSRLVDESALHNVPRHGFGIPDLDLLIAFTGANYADRVMFRSQREFVPRDSLPAVRWLRFPGSPRGPAARP